MKYDCFVFTAVGGKKVNEDSVRISAREEEVVAVLADGLGSHGGGDIASATCADILVAELGACDSENDNAMLTGLFKKANQAVIAKQTMHTEMKSTCVTLHLVSNRCMFMHAGDSRGYIFRDGKVLFQTFDHSIPQMDVLRGNITPEQIRFHPNRNKILRALGIDGIDSEITRNNDIRPGDAFLLCSDGFWEYVTEPEMCIDLAKSGSAESWMNLMLSRIGHRIEPDNDNLSAITIIARG